MLETLNGLDMLDGEYEEFLEYAEGQELLIDLAVEKYFAAKNFIREYDAESN